jgi:hypothetical protein
MRHIGFDESTVLGEFAKIAHKEGLVKTAEEPLIEFGTPVIGNQPGQRVELPGESEMAIIDPRTILTKLDAATGKKYDFLGLLGARYNIHDQKQMQVLKNKLALLLQAGRQHKIDPRGIGLVLKQIRNNVFSGVTPPPKTTPETSIQEQKRYFNYQKVLRMFNQLAQHAKRSSDESNEMTKEAKGEGQKYYDVTGETGEQLVEKAHPGGGTKTELTHSKTDENLVETIVEQQERDIEVARSVPKGTYAELMNLYGALKKMGYSEHLGGLKKIIKSIATPDEVVNYTLTILADKLNSMDFKKHADIVSELLKKKVAQDPKLQLDTFSRQVGDKLIDTVVNALPGGPAAAGQKAVLKGLKGKPYNVVYNNALRLVNTQPDMRGAWNKGLVAINPDVARLTDLQKKVKPAPAPTPVPGGVAGNVEEELEKPTLESLPVSKRKRYPRGPKVKKLQMRFNSAIARTPYAAAGNTLDPDGVFGPKTRAAYNLVKAHGGWKKFEQAMVAKKQKRPVKQKAPPAPPSPPTSANPESVALSMLKRRFGRLPLRRVPELVDIVKQWGREEFGSARKVWSEPKATQEAQKKLRQRIDSLTREDVKPYIRM